MASAKKKIKAGKKTFVRKTLVPPHRWLALRERADPIKRDLMDLIQKHGHAEDYIRRFLEIEAEAWEPHSSQTIEDMPGRDPKPLKEKDWVSMKRSAKGGRPGEWISKNWGGQTVAGENVMYAWHAIEVEYRAARRRNPKEKLGLEPFLKDRYKKKRPFVVQGNEIETAGRARRLHSEAKKLMTANPVLRDIWERRADWGADRKLGIARKLPL
jgi:hypothetical protein